MEQLYRVVTEKLQNVPILRYFNQQLYSPCFMPDVNGYVLIFMQSPHLSGYNLSTANYHFFGDVSKMSIFLATDISPPTVQINMAEVSGTFGGIPYGLTVTETSQFNVTYIDTADIEMYSAHKIWMDYIRQVTIGEIEPADVYMGEGGVIEGYQHKPGWCYIDYMASFFILKFRPSLLGQNLEDNLVFVAKATGAFPISSPDKELIGRRDANELTILPFTYATAAYRQCIFTNGIADSEYSWIVTDLLDILGSQYAT